METLQHYHVRGARLRRCKKSAARSRPNRFAYVSDDDCADARSRALSENV